MGEPLSHTFSIIMKRLFFVILLFAWYDAFMCQSANGFSVINAKLKLSEVFSPNCDLEHGIKGIVNGSGRIDVRIYETTNNVLIYHGFITSTSPSFSALGNDYQRGALGNGAIYYPSQWNSLDIKTSLSSVERKNYDSSSIYPYPYLNHSLNLRIEIDAVNAVFEQCKFPGLGVFDVSGGNVLFPSGHFCHLLENADSPVTQAWMKMKSPDVNSKSDLVIAAHRGVWGDQLGAGDPENSIPAIAATTQYTPILESDIMITGDEQLVVIHDYSLSRLTDYSGDSEDFLFDMTWNQLSNVHLRRRNMEVTNYKLLRFEDLLQLLKQYQLVLTVDIKDIRARYDLNGNCSANCTYDPKTNGETARNLIKQSWMNILTKCIDVADSLDALQYIAFKVPHTYSDMQAYVNDTVLSKVLFMPVIQPNRRDYLEFVDSWINTGKEHIVAFETNFKTLEDTYLQPFTRNGIQYENLLHYVYARTGLRPGCYPEEPMGPKGIVNRWADWLIKDLTRDIRGDHYLLMTIPYGHIMVLTTDRPDIWNYLNNMYKLMP